MKEKLLQMEDVLKLDREKARELYRQHLNPALVRMFSLLNYDRQFVKAQGCEVVDSEGNTYLDFLGGFGSLNFGHNPPKIMEAVNKIAHTPNILQASINTITAAAAANLSAITPAGLDRVFFCNSGAEAVEGTIKLARAASGRKRLLYCDGSFHGKTMGALSLTGREKYQKPFEPLLPGTDRVPYNDVEKLEEALSAGDYAAFVVEPIQGEGGIITPDSGYFKQVRELCDKFDTYLILDEIQTGFGRTGNNFACEGEEIVPDFMTLAKSLGGGVIPVGAFITRPKIWDKVYGSMDTALLHTSTFGGNTRAAAAVVAATDELVECELARKAGEKGEYLLEGLKKMAAEYPLLHEVRGRGLMVGLEFEQPEPKLLDKLTGGRVSKLSFQYLGTLVAGALFNEYRIITAYTLNNPNVIRLEPPLTVSYEQLDRVLNSLEEILSRNKGLLGIAAENARSLFGNLFK